MLHFATIEDAYSLREYLDRSQNSHVMVVYSKYNDETFIAHVHFVDGVPTDEDHAAFMNIIRFETTMGLLNHTEEELQNFVMEDFERLDFIKNVDQYIAEYENG